VTANIFYNPVSQPLDNLGAVMPGCKYKFFESGTTTPTPVYSDANLTSSLGTEVESDTAGRFPVIYLDSTVVYRVQLYGADGTLLGDYDPIHPHVAFPTGTVVMFDGDPTARDAAYPPQLWQVCDGSNGTKDSRDRTPMGVSNTKPISGAGSTGGTVGTVLTTASGGHGHTSNTPSHTLTTNEIPSHGHRAYMNDTSCSGSGKNLWALDNAPSYKTAAGNSGGNALIEPTGGGQGHDHPSASTSTVPDHQHSVTIDPPYFTVWFLRRK